MAMQSQNNRLGSRGGNRSSRSGLGKLPKIGILVLVLVGAGYFFWSGDGTQITGKPANPADQTAAPPTGDPADVQTSTAESRLAADPALSDLAGLSAPGRRPANPTPPASTIKANPQLPTTPPRSAADGGSPRPASNPEIKPDPQVQQAAQTAVQSLPKPRPFDSGADAATLYNRGDQLIASGDLVGGRRVLSRLLFASNLQLSDRDADVIRQRLDDVNNTIFWTNDFVEGCPITKPYKNDGAFLSRIGVQFRVPYQLLEVINGIQAEQLRADHVLKVVQGPIHGRVTKHSFKLDLYALDPEGLPVYLTSFPVGLGKDDKTPLGNWQVVAGSKVVNPDWRDDLNGEYYTSDNPDNPIGEYWIKIRGLDDANRGKQGFGIHGTIEPASIGSEASRGCIRLADDDIKMVFNMLTDHSDGSTIQIVP